MLGKVFVFSIIKLLIIVIKKIIKKNNKPKSNLHAWIVMHSFFIIVFIKQSPIMNNNRCSNDNKRIVTNN